jgi:hypothetical protein
MASHTIGQAAAVEALHMSAQQNRTQTPHDASAAKDGAQPHDKLVCLVPSLRLWGGEY